MALKVLTHSRLSAYRLCPRKHHLSYELGRRPKVVSFPLTFGTATHHCLERYWLARCVSGDALVWRDAAMDAVSSAEGLDDFERARLRVMVAGYVALWNPVACEVLGVEIPFRYPLLRPDTAVSSGSWEMGGKIDVVARFPEGVKVIEHKTTSDDAGPGAVYRQRLDIDGQLSTYWLGASSLGYDVVGIVYDVLGKPLCRPRGATPIAGRKYTKAGLLYKGQRETDETPVEFEDRCSDEVSSNLISYYDRIEVVRFDQELVDYAWDVWHYADRMASDLSRGIAPRNPDACRKYRSLCEYWGVCTGSDTIDNDANFRSTASENEELAVATDVG